MAGSKALAVLVQSEWVRLRADLVDRRSLTFEVLQLIGFVPPLIRIGRWVLHLTDHGPLGGKFRVQGQVLLLVVGEIVLGFDGLDRTFGFAQGAIDAFIRIDDQHVRTFVKAIDGTYLHAVRELALDTTFNNNKCHVSALRDG